MKETLNNSAFPKRFFSVSGCFSGPARAGIGFGLGTLPFITNNCELYLYIRCLSRSPRPAGAISGLDSAGNLPVQHQVTVCGQIAELNISSDRTDRESGLSYQSDNLCFCIR